MKTIFPLVCSLFLWASLAQAQSGQDLIQCPKKIGSSKTDCVKDVALAQESIMMDWAVTYSYTCKYILTPTEPVVLADSENGSRNISYSFQKGTQLVLEVPESRSLTFSFTGTKNPMVAHDCSLIVHSLQKIPARSVIELWKAEARRFVDLIDSKSQLYKGISDYQLLLDNYSLPQLRGMKVALQKMFNDAVALGLMREESDEGNPFEGEEEGNASSGNPADYGLTIRSWSEVDVFSMGLIVLDSNPANYRVMVDRARPEHRWYFDANGKLSVVGSLLSQLAVVSNAALLKEKAEADGYRLPDSEVVKQELVELVEQARAFLRNVESHRDLLKQQVKNLEETLNRTRT